MNSTRYLAVALAITIVALSGINYYSYSILSSQLAQAQRNSTLNSNEVSSLQRTLRALQAQLTPYILTRLDGMTIPPAGSPYWTPWNLSVTALSGPSFGPSSQIIIRGELFTAYNDTLVGSINMGTFGIPSLNTTTNLRFYWLNPTTGEQLYAFPSGQYTATFQPLLCGSPPLNGPSCVMAGFPLRIGPFNLP